MAINGATDRPTNAEYPSFALGKSRFDQVTSLAATV